MSRVEDRRVIHSPEQAAGELIGAAVNGINSQLQSAREFLSNVQSGGLKDFDKFNFATYYPETGEATGKSFSVSREQLLEAGRLLNYYSEFALNIFRGDCRADGPVVTHYDNEDGYQKTEFILKGLPCKLSYRPSSINYEDAKRRKGFNGERQVKLTIGGISFRIDEALSLEGSSKGLELDIGDGFLRREPGLMDAAICNLDDRGHPDYNNLIVGALLSIASVSNHDKQKAIYVEDETNKTIFIDPQAPYPGHHFSLTSSRTGDAVLSLIHQKMIPRSTQETKHSLLPSVGRKVLDFMFGKIGKGECTPSLPGLLRAIGFRDPSYKELEDKVTTDNLTGLYNRNALGSEPVLGELLARLKHCSGLSVIQCDLVDFGKFNKQPMNQKVGDEVLKVFAKNIKDRIRPGDIAIRMGGDEFVIIIVHDPSRSESESSAASYSQIPNPDNIAEIFKKKLSSVVRILGKEYSLETRCGVSTTTEDVLRSITSTEDLSRLIERMIDETSVDMSDRRAATSGVCAGQLVLDLNRPEQPQTPHYSNPQ